MKTQTTKKTTIQTLKKNQGKSLSKACQKHGIPEITRTGKQNKGATGLVLEKMVGLPRNNSKGPDHEKFELKSVPVKKNRQGEIVPKETMAITMASAEDFIANFKDSYFYKKVKKMIIVAKMQKENGDSAIHKVVYQDLTKLEDFLKTLKKDYNILRKNIQQKGFANISSTEGTKYIQLRTKGKGHGSTTRAFYFTKPAVRILLGLSK
jgi:DNA mismatch repair protein MutH